MQLSEAQRRKIDLACLGVDRQKVFVFRTRENAQIGAIRVGVQVRRQQWIVAVVNEEQAPEYSDAITAYIDALYSERINQNG